MDPYTYIDADGAPLTVGTCVDTDPMGSPPSQRRTYQGVIVEIIEPDGDVDDYGRNIGLAPAIDVRFFNGDVERYEGSWTARWHTDDDAPYEFDEVIVADLPPLLLRLWWRLTPSKRVEVTPYMPTVDQVKTASIDDALFWKRFLPSPATPADAEVIGAVVERVAELRKADLAEYTAASKRIGWEVR